jgi:aminoglycoside 6-adenylyltransferase
MNRDAVLAQIVAWAQSRDEVRGALLVGSVARRESPADAYSDLDVVLLVGDPRPWVDDAGWLTEIGDPWIAFVEEAPVGHGLERRVLFADGVDVDFSLFPDSRAGLAQIEGVLQRGARVLLDRDGLLAEAIATAAAAPPSERIERPSVDELQNTVSDVLYHVIWAARKALRGERWMAAECIDCVIQNRLLRLTRWHAAVVLGRSDTWHGGRFLERWADPRAVELLGRAMTTTEPAGIREALASASDLVTLLGGELAGPIGWSYPADAHARVVAWLAEHASD